MSPAPTRRRSVKSRGPSARPRMGAHATSLARCGRGGDDDGVAADDESTENVDERSAWLLPALLLLQQQLAELTLEAAGAEASGQGDGDCGSSMVLAAWFGGLGGGDDAGAAVAVVDEEAGAAII